MRTQQVWSRPSSLSSPLAVRKVSGVEVEINLKVDRGTCGTQGPEVRVSVEILGNATGVEPRLKRWRRRSRVNRVSEATGLMLAGFRNLFGGAGLAEARMSAALLGYAMNRNAREYLACTGLNYIGEVSRRATDPHGQGFKLRFTSAGFPSEIYTVGYRSIRALP